MGSGSYSSSSRSERALSKGYTTKSAGEIFKAKSMNNAMSPFDVKLRESRDSDEHPESLAIVLALDVTGSMGSVPHHLVKKGLPDIMENIVKSGIEHPQLLFMGVGDHECDDAPLQIGQFESSDELLDKWLTDLYLEGGGGGNYGESYSLVWLFAGQRTAIDCFEKRKQKGFLFTVGDEPVLQDYPKTSLKQIFGEGQYETCSNLDLLSKVREKYNVFHIHVREGSNGMRQEVIDGWKQLVGEKSLIIAERKEDIPKLIVDTITKTASGKTPTTKKSKKEEPTKDEEML